MSLFRYTFILLLLIVIHSCSGLQDDPSFTQEEFQDHLSFLASDSLKGRYPGTPEDRVLAEYIVNEYRGAGLKILADDGLQVFEITTDLSLGDSNWFRAETTEALLEEEFIPAGFSANGGASAPVVFAGYGHVSKSDQFICNDYENVDVSGKWVLVLDQLPDFIQEKEEDEYPGSRDKAMLAADHQASGLIIIRNKDEKLPELEKGAAPVRIPVIFISRTLGEKLMQQAGLDLRVLESGIGKEQMPVVRDPGLNLSAHVQLVEERSKTFNTLALLEGSDEQLRNELIVVGAHHDHLGMGGLNTSSRQPDTVAVHFGADDNASGVAMVLEIAEYIAALEEGPRRSMLFMTFGAEEQGLIGSKYYTRNPVMPLDQTYMMLNMDMVGRLNEDTRLQIGGTGTAAEFSRLLEGMGGKDSFKLALSEEGFGPSDHSAFYAKDIPVLFFSTGAHPDYHTPRDNVEGINARGMVLIGETISGFLLELANRDSALTFTEAGPKERKGRRYADMKATLGIMPDIAADPDYQGMRIEFVTPGKPASRAGLKKGDIIRAIEGETVQNVYDYMYRMKNYRPGQQIIVTVMRDKERIDFLVEL